MSQTPVWQISDRDICRAMMQHQSGPTYGSPYYVVQEASESVVFGAMSFLIGAPGAWPGTGMPPDWQTDFEGPETLHEFVRMYEASGIHASFARWKTFTLADQHKVRALRVWVGDEADHMFLNEPDSPCPSLQSLES